MIVSRKNHRSVSLKVNKYTFERVGNFKYLGADINEDANSHEEVKRRLIAANKCYYGLLPLFKSKLLSRKSKVTLYKVLVRPIALCVSSTWATTKSDEKKLEIFERKILRKIFGPKKNNEGEYEVRNNKNLEELYNEPNITGILKSARIGWAGHVWRSKGLIGQITTWKSNAKRPRGRPRQRWADKIKEDLKMLGVRNAEETAQNREDWRRLALVYEYHLFLFKLKMSTKKQLSGYEKRKKKIEQEEHISKLPKISGFFTKTSGLPTNVLPEHMDKFVHSDKNSTTELISNDTHTENKTGGLLSFNTETRKSTDEDETIESTTPPDRLTLTKESDTTEFTENNDDCELDLSARFPTDRGMFKNCVSDKLKREILKYGPCKPEIDFPLNDSKRKFSKIYYYVKLKNGTLIPRPWLCYSKINIHEFSLSHLNAMKVRSTWTKNLTIDKEFETQISKEAKFWRDILTRIVKIILTLTAGNTALRGNEGKQYSEGNFLRTVKLVAEFDPILKSVFDNEKKFKIKYLIPTIQNELIEILASNVRQIICNEISTCSSGFSIIMDSTQDITKVDQVSVIIRYVIRYIIDHEKHVLQVK
ncbi:hypothetical protein QTP88_028923 [Uroleucon formosanum]